MGGVALTWESCVRTRSTSAQCRRCVDACPTAAVTLDGPKGSVAVALAACIDCGLCHAACPTEAFRAPFDVAAFVTAPRTAVTCGDGLPCVGALAAEDLVVLALANGALALTPKPDCAAAATGHGAASQRADEANGLLEALGATARVTVEAPPAPAAPPPAPPKADQPSSPDRRAFFRSLVGGAKAPPQPLRLDVAALKAQLLRLQRLPERRERLLEALSARTGQVERPTLPEAGVGFSSDKRVDVETCTACNLCVTVCPTGALTTSRQRDELRFAASKCVKCRACHDVCQPRAITLAPAFDVAAFTGGAARLLASLPVLTCGECGAFFKAAPGEVRCANCRDLDDEARELTGLR